VKRSNGDGSVYKLTAKRDKPWCATVTDGWTLAGRPVRRSRFAATRAEAMLELTDMLAARRNGRPVADTRLTLHAFLPAWLAGRTDLRPSTIKVWRLSADHLLRRLGSIRVRQLTPSDVEAACADMPPGIAVNAKTLLTVALGDAQRDGLVDRNVARLARSRRATPAPTVIPTAEEARRLIAAAPSHRLGALIVAALGTGLRQGELLGLTRECLDLDAGTARIEWALKWDGPEPSLGAPKTASSVRVQPLPPFVIAALRTHRAQQDAERLAAGTHWRDADGLVFTTALGSPVHPNTARYMLDMLCERAGLPHVRFHDLRHAAGALVKAWASQEAAQSLLGHSSITMTDRYAPASADLAVRAAQALQEALG
jgi:integrase